MIEEIWKDIKGYEGLYQVSNLGNVRSLDRLDGRGWKIRGRMLTPMKYKKGYLYVGLCKNNIRKCYKIHRLVAQTFIPNPDNKPEIDHINCCKTDNRVINLRFVTAKENNNNPLTLKHRSNCKKGTKNIRHRSVIQYDIDGNFIREWDTITDAEKTLGITHKIHYVCQGKRRTCGGYIWKYKRVA
jgi:hypothetical protein